MVNMKRNELWPRGEEVRVIRSSGEYVAEVMKGRFIDMRKENLMGRWDMQTRDIFGYWNLWLSRAKYGGKGTGVRRFWSMTS